MKASKTLLESASGIKLQFKHHFLGLLLLCTIVYLLLLYLWHFYVLFNWFNQNIYHFTIYVQYCAVLFLFTHTKFEKFTQGN